LLDPDEMLRAAVAAVGLDDFGDPSFERPFRHLLEMTAAESELTEAGVRVFRANVQRGLANRLRYYDDLARFPEIAAEDVADPLVVIGLPRSGTTKLMRMLASPDSVQKTLYWRVLYPGRFTSATLTEPDPRIAAARGGGEFNSEGNAEMEAVHVMTAEEVEEDTFILESAFTDRAWAMSYGAPTSWYDYAAELPQLQTYRYGRGLLQYLQWQDGGKQGRPWLLKSPFHMAHLRELLDCYPGAVVVHTHRDPRQSIPSMAKLQSMLWSTTFAQVDHEHAGRKVLDWWSREMERYLAVREELQLDDRILDVQYEQVRSDPMAIVREIYARAGREMSVEAERAMARWHTENEQGAKGANSYTLGEFGLTEEAIDGAFAAYTARFIHQ
jgi:hypothetical protein